MLAKPSERRELIAAEDVFAAVHAAGGCEFGVVEGLRAETDAIDAGGKPGGGLCRSDGFRVGLEGNFCGARSSRARAASTELGTDGIEDAGEVGGIEEAGRAAAEIDGVGKGTRRISKIPRAAKGRRALGYKAVSRVQAGGFMEGAPVADFAIDGAGVRGVGRGRSDSGMEVAVGALGLAERHLDIDAEGMASRVRPDDIVNARKLLISMTFARRVNARKLLMTFVDREKRIL